MIDNIRKNTDADFVIAVMSGDFTQRGLPAVCDKYTRAEMAIQGGVDAVFELPTVFATGSANIFASGAVSLINNLGCVDLLAFGSECGNTDDIVNAADHMISEKTEESELIKKYLKDGLSYPQALSNALEANPASKKYAELLKKPNNMLGMEYIKALKQLGSKITPYTVQRIGVDHDSEDTFYSKEDHISYTSASNIRSLLTTETGSISKAAAFVPKITYQLLTECYCRNFPVHENDTSLPLFYKLMNETTETISQFQDMSEDLGNRILERSSVCTSFTDLVTSTKHKQYTYTRICRALIHTLLGITKESCDHIGKNAPYARLLGVAADKTQHLKALIKKSSIPIITKAADAFDCLSDQALELFKYDLTSADLYSRILTQKFKTPFVNDIRHSIEPKTRRI